LKTNPADPAYGVGIGVGVYVGEGVKVGVEVGVKVGVEVEVDVGVSVIDGVGVYVGPNNLHGPQEVRMKISTSNRQIYFLCID
jgi:hypothetical protein